MTDLAADKKLLKPALNDILQKGRNNFNLIRLFMALFVLYNHSFVLFNDRGGYDIFSKIFTQFDAGSLGVCVFFLISGLLLSQSFYQSKTHFSFVIKRLLRLFPGLIVCIFFCVMIIGPLSTSKPIADYFKSHDTIRYFYNVLLNNEYTAFQINGCFLTNKHPEIMNGSLWTLPFELLCYIILFLILWLFKILSPVRIKQFIIIIISVYFFIYLSGLQNISHRIKGLLTGFTYQYNLDNNPFKLYLFFFTGSILYFLRNKIRIGLIHVLVSIIALIVCRAFSFSPILVFLAEFLFIGTGVLYIAGLNKLFKLNSSVDPSYGIYLYAWPIQQLTAYYLNVDSYLSMLITIPITLLLGIISYKFIEKPSLNLSKSPILQDPIQPIINS